MHRKFLEENLLLATNNNYKIGEIKKYFANIGNIKVNFFTPADFNIPSPNETEDTFIGNAELKARFYGNITGMPALADDTGICIDALDGFPGVYTADWISEHGDPEKLINKVEKEVTDSGEKTAKAVCALSLYWPADGHMESFLGEAKGELDFSFKNLTGIGFTRIFIPKGYKEPYALLNFEQKLRTCHRGRAFAKLIKACFSA